MLRRNFGHVNHDQSPIGGYDRSGPNLPKNHYVYEGNRPRPETRQTTARFVLRHAEVEPPFEEIEPVPELYEGQQLGNEELPIHEFRETIKDALKNNQITILVGGTGSGKSTQLPQYALEAGFEKVFITQPRRIATYGVISRIEEELSGKLGEKEAKKLVAYQTAEASTVTKDSKIIGVTDGIEAVRRLNDEKIEASELRIIDEVHERNTNIDVTLALIKKKLVENPNARFALTTATINAQKLSEYFADVTGKKPPIIEVPGRPYEIEKIEEPTSTVAVQIMECLHKYPGKSMLVFLPGKREINDTMDKIYGQFNRSIRQNTMILPLHAKLPKEQQDRIKIDFKGTKIILSTNVAQTSVTIPDADIVIDCSEERRIQLDGEGVEGLGKHPISQADVIQRMGRTGRVADGIYIRTRYDEKSRFKQFKDLDEFPTPEILRSDIDRTTLRTAAVGIDLEDLDLLDPVDLSAIDRSKESLRMLDALDDYNHITTTGLLMNRYPIKPSSGRMMVESLRHSANVQSYLAAITASIEVGGLAYFAPDVGRAWHALVDGETDSDLLAQLKIFTAIQHIPEENLSEYDLDVQNVKRAQEQYQKIVRVSQSFNGELIPPSQDEIKKIKECIYSGLITNLYRNTGRDGYVRVYNDKTRTLRKISDRSIVDGGKFVVGTPYRVEFMQDGVMQERHIIEQATNVDNVALLGQSAIKLCRLVPAGIVWSKDKPVRLFHKMLFDIKLGEVKREAEPSPEVRKAVIQDTMINPRGAQKELRFIKKELEELQHLTKQHVPQITQDVLLGLIEQAAPTDVLNPGVVDENLRILMTELGLNLESIIPQEERQRIHNNAPEEMIINGKTLHIAYRDGQPFVRDYDMSAITNLDEEIYLEDLREVTFVSTDSNGRAKRYNVAGLRRRAMELVEQTNKIYA